ncbi:TIGR01212 family radical SAM protein, partial [Bacillus sp. SIMBA_161]
NRHLRGKFGEKIMKISLDAGFDCPNRDGTVAFGGCTFCSVAGSGDFAGDRVDPIPVQFEQVKANMHHKWKDAKYIAYFQAYTNTHA